MAPASLTSGSYRPHLVVEPGQMLGVVFIQADVPMPLPGQKTIATVALMYEGVDYSVLVPGAIFDVVEGSQVVATGRVLPS